jgi:LysM repeat protein
LAILAFSLFVPGPAEARETKEGTAYITLKKDSPATLTHQVQPGETLGGIIKQRLGRVSTHLRAVRQLNPQITDINRIYPGQSIILPQPGTTPPPEAALLPGTYRVVKGDTLAKIFRQNLGGPSGNWRAFLAEMQQLNPELAADPNRLFPGQILRLPGPRQAAPALPPAYAAKVEKVEKVQDVRETVAAFSSEANLEILRILAERMGARLIRQGIYHVPLASLSNLTLDNALIPQIEFPDGAVAILDFGSHIPEGLARSVNSTWPHIQVINLAGNLPLPDLWARIFPGDPFPLFSRTGRIFLYDKQTQLELPADGVLTWKRSGPAEPHRQVIIITGSPESLLPPFLHPFAARTGTVITEIMAGKVMPQATPPPANPPAPFPLLAGETPGPFAANLMGLLGWKVGTNEEINLGDQAREGFSLTFRVPLAARKGGKTVLVTFEPLPPSFTSVLASRGYGLILLTRTMSRRDITLTLLQALDTPHAHAVFDFPLREIAAGRRGVITFPAIQAETGKDTLYLVDFDLDPYLQAFLMEKGPGKFFKY